MNDKTIKKNITRLWNQAYINYDDCYAHGLKSEEEKKEWLRFLRKVNGDYDKDTKEELPMMKSRNARRLGQMVQNAGLKVTVIPMTEVDRAEKQAMPLRYRLLNPHKRITVIGVKE